MTLSWDDLGAAIEANDAARVEELILGATEPQRRACWPQVESLTPYSERKRLKPLGVSGLKLAVAGTAPSARKLAELYWPDLDAPDTHARAAELLVTRDPSWLEKLAEPLLGHGWGWNWPLLRELVRRGSVALPDDREEYLREMVSTRAHRSRTVREMLDADPGLLETEVYELFEHEECAAQLAAADHWVTHVWDRESARSVPGDGGDPHAQSWAQVLADVAHEGRLDRSADTARPRAHGRRQRDREATSR